MLNKQTAKFIKSLQQKKFRTRENAFVVEGEKNVLELLHSDFNIKSVYASPKFIETHGQVFQKNDVKIENAKETEISNCSFLKTNITVLAVAEITKSAKTINTEDYILAFDNIQDPGNLGTIIRTADWYGFQNIVCSTNSVDCYNPKVIAATMGSFARVNIQYLDLEAYIKEQNLPVYGALLLGENIHTVSFQEKGILLFGNESKGISEPLKKTITHEVLIKGFGKAESLNVAIATAVFCDNLRRNVGV